MVKVRRYFVKTNLKIPICIIEYNDLRNSKSKYVYCFLLLNFQKIVHKHKKVLDKTLSGERIRISSPLKIRCSRTT